MPRSTRVVAGLAAALLVVAGIADDLKLDVPVWTLDGLRVVVHGEWGSGPGQFGKIDAEHAYGPTVYTIDSAGNFVILDGLGGNSRIQVFDHEGTFSTSVRMQGVAAIQAVAADGFGGVYLPTWSEITRVDLTTSRVESIGSPEPVFGEVRDLAVARLRAHPPEQPAPRTLLFLQQAFSSLDGGEMWVHLYECETRLVRQSGLRGSQPVLDGTGTLYVIGPAVDVAEGSLVTVKRWNYQELRVVESPFFVPVKISPHNRCYLTGVAGYPPRLYLYTYDAETGAPGYVWKYDRAGRLMGAVSLTEHLPPTPVRWMSSAARFAVDAAGDLCVSWADPEKGYSISKLPTSQLGE